jgi:hypothetical protein
MSAAFFLTLATPAVFAASTLIPVTDRVDHIYDSLSDQLLISTENGNIERWDFATQSLIEPIELGGELRKLEITPDLEFVVVADYLPTDTTGRFRQVDLATLDIVDYVYDLDFGEDGAWDVAIGMDGKGFATTQFGGSGRVPLREIDITDNSLVVIDAPTSNGEVRQRTHATRTPDRSFMLLQESNTSAGTIHLYDAAAQMFIGERNTGNFQDGSAASLKPEFNRVVVEGNRDIEIHDLSLNLIRVLEIESEGLIFDPVNARLFYAEDSEDVIVSLSAISFEELQRWPIGENYTSSAWFSFGEIMSTNDDGTLLFLSTNSGVRIIDTPLLPAGSDRDTDGLGDYEDNCVGAANPDQTDADNDGLGNICDGDLNNDGSVNFVDLGLFRKVFFTTDAVADFNSDGTVNFQDLGILRGLFFQ